MHSWRGHDLPDSDQVISVTREQVLAVLRPSQGDTNRRLTLSNLRLQLILQSSLLKVEDLDRRRGSSAKPESVWREGQSVNLMARVQSVQQLLWSQVPKNDNTVLTTGSAKGSIWGRCDAGNVTVMADEVGGQSSLSQVPRLDRKWRILMLVKWLLVERNATDTDNVANNIPDRLIHRLLFLLFPPFKHVKCSENISSEILVIKKVSSSHRNDRPK